MKLKFAIVIAVVLALTAQWLALPAIAAGPEFLFQQTPPPPLENSRTFVLVGKHVDAGCSYRYPKTVRPAWASTWEVRDLGIDQARCMKLVEEGVPTTTSASTAGVAISTPIGSNSVAPAGGVSIQSTLSGYAENWWEDFVGKTVTKDRTDVTWQFDGSCATGGSTNGTWSWFADSGWLLDSNGGTNNTYCSYHLGETYSSFHNTAFCGYTVYSVYSYVRFYGYYNGTWDGARSSYASTSCLPLYEHYLQGGPA